VEYPLSPVMLRLAHATALINNFDRQSAAWMMNSRRSIQDSYDPQSGILRAHIGGDVPPRELGLILGDILHSLRAALDNLVALMLDRQGVALKETHQFPFVAKDNSKGRAEFQKRLTGVGRRDVDIIWRSQPFTWGEHVGEHPLSKLRRFSNADKHRLLLPAGVVFEYYVSSGENVTFISPIQQLVEQKSEGFEFSHPVNGVLNGELVEGFTFFFNDVNRLWEARIKNVTAEPHFTYASAPVLLVGFKHENIQLARPGLLQMHAAVADLASEVAESWGYRVIKSTSSE
jgi:hypothetical protein